MNVKVVKFGGSSLADAKQITKAANIIKKRQYPQICGAVGSGQAVLRGRKGYGYAL